MLLRARGRGQRQSDQAQGGVVKGSLFHDHTLWRRAGSRRACR
ncbi:Uncharacterised protein [Bordetella pertussis]|nr:Uncharacterised protein [Bordetella pertussis]